MRSSSWPSRAVVVILLLCACGQVWGQGPTLPEPSLDRSSNGQSLLGPALGGMGPVTDSGPGGSDEPLSGRVGTAVPRVPAAITMPGNRQVGVPERERITTPSALPLSEVPLIGPLSVPRVGEEVGPADGLSLDQAIERLVHENLALKARGLELPQADADILTASLRANPVLFADSQLIPYGNFTEARPGGQTQYDLNITYPLDVTRKRKARTHAAVTARNVLQAQYQDSVRIQIDNLYTIYCEYLGARETIRFAQFARQGLEELLGRTRGLQEKGVRTIADVSRIEALVEAAEIQVMDGKEALMSARRNLGVLLNMPGNEAEALELRGTLRDSAPPPPPVDELIRMALQCRPDVVAYRMGIHRAQAEVKLATANRMSDVYLLYQPYTFQDNRPTDKLGATSWALGLTVPLPIYNRNQGNIQRSRVNLTQSHVELAEREQQVVNEVRQAERQYLLTRAAVQRIETRLIPPATRVRDDAYRLYIRGEEDAIIFLNAQREFNEASRQYRDMLVRHRQAMLRLNTAVGQRLMP